MTGVDGELRERVNVGESGERSPERDFGMRREKKLRAGEDGDDAISASDVASSEIISPGRFVLREMEVRQE